MKIIKEELYKGFRLTLRERRVLVPLEGKGTIFYNTQHCFIDEEDVTPEIHAQGAQFWNWFEWAKNRIDQREE